MGNRGGALHNDQREVVRSFKTKCWLTCRLEFNGRHRVVMSPHHYTELFFLDEATAFAAGHRPCFECRRGRFNAFKDAWRSRSERTSSASLCAAEIDAELHQSRIDERGRKRTYQLPMISLPNGCFAQITSEAYLVWNDALLLWTPEGYRRRICRPNQLTVTVLTPRPIVECFQRGYAPEIHESARAQ